MNIDLQELANRVLGMSSNFDIAFHTQSLSNLFANFIPSNPKRVFLIFYNTIAAAQLFVRPIGSPDAVGIPLGSSTTGNEFELHLDKHLLLCQVGWQARFSVVGPNTAQAISVSLHA